MSNYSISVGGMHLFKDGEHIAEIGTTCQYNKLDYKNVQFFWRLLSDPRMQQAFKTFSDMAGAVLGEGGEKHGIEKDLLTEEDLESIQKLIIDLEPPMLPPISAAQKARGA